MNAATKTLTLKTAAIRTAATLYQRSHHVSPTTLQLSEAINDSCPDLPELPMASERHLFRLIKRECRVYR